MEETLLDTTFIVVGLCWSSVSPNTTLSSPRSTSEDLDIRVPNILKVLGRARKTRLRRTTIANQPRRSMHPTLISYNRLTNTCFLSLMAIRHRCNDFRTIKVTTASSTLRRCFHGLMMVYRMSAEYIIVSPKRIYPMLPRSVLEQRIKNRAFNLSGTNMILF